MLKYLKHLSIVLPSLCLGLLLALSCSKPSSSIADTEEEIVDKTALPYKQLALDDLSSFKKTIGNWQIVGNVNANREEERLFTSSPGSGIIVNTFKEEDEEELGEDFDWNLFHLFTLMEHGDIDLELDVMMPVGSNSGIYFQGRYEIQLFDSWQIEKPQQSDMGGIYERWDDSKPEAAAGYEGRSPRLNAAKAPGLWQHFKIKFRAPVFDEGGQKTAPARFEEVWLNGVLIHENEVLTGPTRAAPFEDEQALGPLMFQGEHGPVAFKNINYKLYGQERVSYKDLTIQQYKYKAAIIPDTDTLLIDAQITSDSISANAPTGMEEEKLLVYKGNLIIPKAGIYLFEVKFMGGGGLLEVNNEELLFMDDINWPETSGYGQSFLPEGMVPFRFVYNQALDDERGFSIQVEGPEIPWHLLSAPGSLIIDWEDEERPEQPIVIQVSDQPVLQRSFFMHNDVKRTHVISIGTPSTIHFAYDLLLGSLLSIWAGNFLDVSDMWHDRGEEQLGKPLGASVAVHGNLDFAILSSENEQWPDTIPEGMTYRSLGYKLQADGYPIFLHKIHTSIIKNRFEVSKSPRKLKRFIDIDSKTAIWHKLGTAVEKLPDGTFAMDEKRYYIELEQLGNAEMLIRQNEDSNELLLKIPEGVQHISYNIIW